jgi:hypothetical protein
VVWSQVGTFTKRTSTGDDSVTGLPGTPKFVLLWTAHATVNRTVRTSWRFSVGMASGTTAQASVGTFSADAQPSSLTDRRQDDTALLVRVDSAGTATTVGTLASFDANGFTITWSGTIQEASLIHYMAMGGDDLSAKVVKYLLPDLGAGATDVTGAGFTPTGALAIHSGQTATPTSGADATHGFGAIGTDGSQFAINVVAEDGETVSDTARLSDNTKFAFKMNPADTTAQSWSTAWNSWNSDGMNIQITEHAAGEADDYIFIAFFNGIKLNVGSFNKDSTTAPFSQDIVTGLSYTPVATILASDAGASPTMGSNRAHADFSLGASDGTNHAASQLVDWDGIGTTQADSWDANDRAFIQISSSTDDTLDTLATIAHTSGKSTATFDESDTALLSTIFYVTFGPNVITGTAALKLPFPWMTTSGRQSQDGTAALTLPFPVMTSGPQAPLFDAVTTTGQASGTSLSFSHTVGSFNQRALIVSLAYRAATSPNATASSVTYNGVAMSKIRRDSANHRKSEMWVLANPDTGAHNVVVTWDADPEQQVASANSYYFVDQRAPVATSGGATGSGNAQSVSVTADANQRVVAVGSVYPAGGSNLPATPDANVTERWEYGAPADNINGFGGDRLGAGGATSIGWTHPNTGDTWAISAAVLNPASNNQILSGTGIFTLPFPVVTAVGVGPSDASGTSAMVLPFPRMAVTVGLQIMRGSSALVLPFPVMAGIGAQEYLGTGAFTLPFPVMTAAGTHPVADPPVGTAVLTLPFPVMAGSGYMLPEGTSQLTLPFPVMAGVGEQSLLGTSSLVLPFPVMAGVGEQSQLGTSALVLPFPVMSSSGLISMEGTSALVLPFPVLSSAGTHGASATSALVLPFPVMSAAGIYSEYARYLERLLRILYPTRSIQLINPTRSYNVLLPERKLQVLD